jgi:hypothetical protein
MSGDCKPAIVKPNYSKNSSGKKGSSGFLTSVVHTLRLIDCPGSLITFCHMHKGKKVLFSSANMV